jgi:hypothetical protein
MITEKFVIIPLQRQDIIPIGIGSVKIDQHGSMTVVIPDSRFGVNRFGKDLEEKFRQGKIKALRIEVIPIEEDE